MPVATFPFSKILDGHSYIPVPNETGVLWMMQINRLNLRLKLKDFSICDVCWVEPNRTGLDQ